MSARSLTSFLLPVILCCAIEAFAQEPSRSKPVDPSRPVRPFVWEESALSHDLLREPVPNLDPGNFPAYFRQSIATSATLSWDPLENTRLRSIWQQEMARKNEYKTLKSILGSVQVGATAYLMYLHLKRYGLKK